MVRENLEKIPECALPAGFSLRWYQPGDEARWLQIDTLANPDSPVSPDFFPHCFGSDPVVLARRQCYLLNQRAEAIGTATAWFDDHFEGARFGRVHYVAIVPAYQGRGLSRPLMTVICHRLRQLGHDRAYLATSTARIAAINLYRRFGFQPLVRSAEEAAAWRGLCSRGPAAKTNSRPCREGQSF